MLNPATTMSLDYRGAITGLYGDTLHGWALHPQQPDVRLALEIYVDGAFASLARADQMQQHYDEGDGFHGFTARLNASWLENASHIAVRVANEGPWLATLQLPAADKPSQPAPGASQVWYPGGLKVTGWAWDTAAPTRHVTVTARVGERIVAQASASNPHPALVYRPTADHGFSLDLPWELADGNVHTVHLENDLGEALTGSPITVCTLPEGMEALLRRLWPGQPDDPSLQLLIRLAQDQDRRAPRTIGFEHYDAWFKVFQQPQPLAHDGPGAALKAGILLYGQGSEHDEAASRDSVRLQRWPAHAIVRAQPNGLPQAAHQLLSQGADAIVPLHVGDRLAPHALDTLLPVLAADPQATQRLGVRSQRTRGAAPQADATGSAPAWVYADNDCDGEHGQRTAPWLKPAWDIDLFLGADLVTPGAAYGADIVRAAFGMATHPPGGTIHDFAAAIAAATNQRGDLVAHVPRVLYHQRHGAPTSPADAPANPERQAAITWLASHLAPGSKVTPNPLYPGLLQVEWPLPANLPKVSLIVPTRDHYKLLHACVEGLLTQTDYPNLEVIVVDNDSTCPQTLAYMEELATRGVVILRHPGPFNYSAINNRAVEIATGEIIGLINNDIEVIEAGWLKTMVAQLLQPGVGIVGAKLLWPNGMVQHGGVVVGVNGLAAHVGNHWLANDAGPLGFNQLTRSQHAVTAACLVVRKVAYRSASGLNATSFPIAFNDVDFCLRLAEAGRVISWHHRAVLTHRESASRGKDDSPQRSARATREQGQLLSLVSATANSYFHYHPALTRAAAPGAFGALSDLG